MPDWMVYRIQDGWMEDWPARGSYVVDFFWQRNGLILVGWMVSWFASLVAVDQGNGWFGMLWYVMVVVKQHSCF